MLIHVSPEQFEQMLDDRFSNAFQKYLPSFVEKEPPLPELLTVKQVCKLLHITRPTLDNWSKDTPDRAAILVPLKVEKRILYRREDVLNVAKESRRFKATK